MDHLWWLVPMFIVAGLVVLGAAFAVAIVLVFKEARRAQERWAASVAALGLVEDPTARAHGWKSLARGTWQGVPLAVGERTHTRRMSEGTGMLMCVEVASIARNNLGRFEMADKSKDISQTATHYTGEPTLDARYIFRDQTGGASQSLPSPFSPGLPLVQVACMDQRVRQLLLKLHEMEAFIVHDTAVSVALRSRTPENLQCAVELVTYLARWPGGDSQLYR